MQKETVIGSARVHGVRDGSESSTWPCSRQRPEHLHQRWWSWSGPSIETQEAGGAQPVIRAAEAVEVIINGIIELQEGADMESVRTQAGRERWKSYLAGSCPGRKERNSN